MENVKTSSTILEPDVRRSLMSIVNRRTGNSRPFALTDIEARLSDIVIPSNAPEEVNHLLVTAKNLLLYSWFYYPFTMTATLQAAAALERALKIRLLAKPRDTLSYLLKTAVTQNLLTDAGFPRWNAHIQSFRKLHQITEPPSDRKLTEILIEVVPDFRNAVAHGDSLMSDLGFQQLDICVEAITQLYPSKDKN